MVLHKEPTVTLLAHFYDTFCVVKILDFLLYHLNLKYSMVLLELEIGRISHINKRNTVNV